jgi:hypothetical protein
MWFKTRVGFITVTAPMEILAAKNAPDGSWFIYVRLKNWPEAKMKSFFKGQASMGNPSGTLAIFSDGPAVSKAIAECMGRIENAIRTKAELCDLSQCGDARAWPKGWKLIQWPDEHPNN